MNKKYTQADIDFFADNADEYFNKMLEYRKALIWLADLHHRTLDNSKLHNPEVIENFRNCPCLTCKRVTELVGEE